jgi:hypothetical protein
MAVTAAELMVQLGEMVQEDGWETNNLWNVPEIIEYINTTCKDFILRSQVLKVVAPVESVTAQRLYDDPVYTMQMDRISFSSRPLYRTNRYLLDRENPKWKTLAGVPKQYHQDQLPTKTFETDRAPTSVMTGSGYTVTLPASGRGGVLRTMSGGFGYTATLPAAGRGGLLRYVLGTIAYNATLIPGRPHGGVLRQMFDGATNFEVIATVLTGDVTDATDELPVPDFCVVYIKFGVLEKMLSKEGEGQDLARSQYCSARYDNGIALFRRLIDGKDVDDAKAKG